MVYKQLYLFVEGTDEDRFFNSIIIKSMLGNRYDFIGIWPYAQQPHKDTKNFLKSVKAMNSDYFFLKDINSSPCATAKKEDITSKYRKRVDAGNIVVLIKEIESWYLAGLDDKSCREIGIRPIRKTDDVTKEQFNNLRPKRFDSHIDFMQETLKRFSIETAKKKNKSFRYFMTKIEAR